MIAIIVFLTYLSCNNGNDDDNHSIIRATRTIHNNNDSNNKNKNSNDDNDKNATYQFQFIQADSAIVLTHHILL